MEPNRNSLTLFWYSTVVFVSSAVVMILEITAGRLLAPFVGVSLYTWTSIIGVVLAGLSLGSWIGGRWADRGADQKRVGLVLTIAGLFSLSSLFILTLIAPALQNIQMSLISTSFIYMGLLFFIPALLLGIVTPLLTTLSLKLDQRTGHIVGRMHALAALGSIIGTFATGYWLVQYFGTRNIIIVCSALLFVLSLPFYGRPKQSTYTFLIAPLILILAITAARDGFTTPCDKESNYFCIRIVDYNEDLPFGDAKAMVLDHLIHGVNHNQQPGMFISPYVHLMDELVLNYYGGDKAKSLNYFFAGGGAYTHARGIKHFYPDTQITVAELDPLVTELAQQKLFLDTSTINIKHEDARLVLQNTDEQQYDVIVSDVYHDIAIPYHLVTQQYHQLIKTRLKEEGLYVTNIVDIFPDPQFLKSIIKTIAVDFKYVEVWLETIPETPTRVTYVISASNESGQGDTIHAQRGFERSWYNITEPLLKTGTSLATLPLLTDDFAPVDRLMSRLLLSEIGN